MAIIKCPECGHQISEKATVCPSCGVEIAGKITKCLGCGEVFFIDMGLCPHCYRPFSGHKTVEPEEEETIVETPAKDETPKKEPVKEEPAEVESHAEEKEVVPIEAERPMTEDAEDDVTDISIAGDDSYTEMEDQEEEEAQEEEVADTSDPDNEDESEDQYIDTDGEQLEKPVHEAEDDGNPSSGKKNYIPIIVSLAITALIAAVCFYFYQDTKMSRETEAFELAMKSNDVQQMNSFLRNFTDASTAHKKAINDKIASITKEEQALSLSLVTRDKAKLTRYLADYPDSPQRQKILAMIDSIDWEEAVKTNTKAAYDQYIAEHATGLFIKEAKDKVAVKVLAASAEDEAMAKSLFREFFLSVNGNDAARLSPTLHSEISSFMGTEKASSGQVVDWMKRQHGDDVSSVIWKLNHDYKINKREQGGSKEYDIEFTAKQTIVRKDGRSSSENYRIQSKVTGNNKISSMNMSKYVPQAAPATSTTSSSSSSQQAKPATQSASASKPSSSAQAKPAASTQPKPAASTQSKPASSTQSKPAASTQPKPAASTQSKPAASTQSKPAASTQSKPATSSQAKPADKGQAQPKKNAPKPSSQTNNTKK